MEIYKDLSSPASQQFEKLLNTQLSKNKIEEGKIIEGKITKITEKYIFLFIQGLKSEPVIDINEMKLIGMQNKIVEGEKISVLLEKIEDKNGDVIKELKIPKEKVNVNGGAIALGHPIGASGARIVVTLLNELKKISGKKGLATLCIGGGMGISMCIEKD